MNEIKINIPDGMEIDKENSTFECIKFKPIEKELPKTWEEYCRNTKRKVGEAWIDGESDIYIIDSPEFEKSCIVDRNLLPSKELAEAMLAICQLIQLRDCYNDNWKPDWNTSTPKYCIHTLKNNIEKCVDLWCSHILVFKSELIRDEFMTNFKDWIEIAKPLL